MNEEEVEKRPVYSMAKVEMELEDIEDVIFIAEQIRDVSGLFGIHEAAITAPEPSIIRPGFLRVDLLLIGSEAAVHSVLTQLLGSVENRQFAADNLAQSEKVANEALLKRDAKRDKMVDDNGAIPNCDVCNKSYTVQEWEDRHNPHDEGCLGVFDPRGCSCDNNTHARCCWDCHPPK